MNLKDTIKLLKDDNLVWSGDFEIVRKPLAKMLEKIEQIDTHQFDDEIFEICSSLDAGPSLDGPDDPLESWIVDSARQLGIYEYSATKSRSMAQALKKLFNQL